MNNYFEKLGKLKSGWPDQESQPGPPGYKTSIRPLRQLFRGTVAERLARSLPTKAIQIQSPAGSLRIFARGNRAGRCRWLVGFLANLPFPHPFIPALFHTYLNHRHRLDFKSRSNLFTHYAPYPWFFIVGIPLKKVITEVVKLGLVFAPEAAKKKLATNINSEKNEALERAPKITQFWKTQFSLVRSPQGRRDRKCLRTGCALTSSRDRVYVSLSTPFDPSVINEQVLLCGIIDSVPNMAAAADYTQCIRLAVLWQRVNDTACFGTKGQSEGNRRSRENLPTSDIVQHESQLRESHNRFYIESKWWLGLLALSCSYDREQAITPSSQSSPLPSARRSPLSCLAGDSAPPSEGLIDRERFSEWSASGLCSSLLTAALPAQRRATVSSAHSVSVVFATQCRLIASTQRAPCRREIFIADLSENWRVFNGLAYRWHFSHNLNTTANARKRAIALSDSEGVQVNATNISKAPRPLAPYWMYNYPVWSRRFYGKPPPPPRRWEQSGVEVEPLASWSSLVAVPRVAGSKMAASRHCTSLIQLRFEETVSAKFQPHISNNAKSAGGNLLIYIPMEKCFDVAKSNHSGISASSSFRHPVESSFQPFGAVAFDVIVLSASRYFRRRGK
ncbi:hypothetical protein PR048_000502 [Dryococelus australis]|uniref:Uncharacterized protein n=1 Tax=Dryococelus australis TaxID=614101 RepID=A0ABQ9IFD0_9NEOP|nr:hypothetical protein PR048_000502 [Dryococelus australis]